MAFWGVEVKPGMPFHHSRKDAKRLRLTQAVLGIGNTIEKSLLQCIVGSSSPVFLCALFPSKVESCHLCLEFEEEDDVIFSVIGPRSVHLAGYYVCHNHPSYIKSPGIDIENPQAEKSSRHIDDDDKYEVDFVDNCESPATAPSPSPCCKGKKKLKDKKSSGKQIKKKCQVIETDGDLKLQESNDREGKTPVKTMLEEGKSNDDSEDCEQQKEETLQGKSPLHVDELYPDRCTKEGEQLEGVLKVMEPLGVGIVTNEDVIYDHKAHEENSEENDVNPNLAIDNDKYQNQNQNLDEKVQENEPEDRCKDISLEGGISNEKDALLHCKAFEDNTLQNDVKQDLPIDNNKDQIQDQHLSPDIREKPKVKLENQSEEGDKMVGDEDINCSVVGQDKIDSDHVMPDQIKNISEKVRVSDQRGEQDTLTWISTEIGAGNSKNILEDGMIIQDSEVSQGKEKDLLVETLNHEETVVYVEPKKRATKKKKTSIKKESKSQGDGNFGTRMNEQENVKSSPNREEKLQCQLLHSERRSCKAEKQLKETVQDLPINNQKQKLANSKRKWKVQYEGDKKIVGENVNNGGALRVDNHSQLNSSMNAEHNANSLGLSNDASSDNGRGSKKKKKEFELTSPDGTLKQDEPVVDSLHNHEDAKKLPLEVKVLSNRLVVEELARGDPNGKVAAIGRKVKVHFTGMLKENGQIIESTFDKSFCKFYLGDQKVMDGLNIGIDGMRVGDKRRLIIPPSLGFGEVGYAEKVPPNSWLEYHVELIGVCR